MAGFNWIDVVIILLLAGSIYYGIRIGFLTLLLILCGFFGGLFLGGWVFPHLLPIHDHTLLTIINGNLVFIFAVFLAFLGYDLGRRVHVSLTLRGGSAHKLEAGAGVTLSLGSALIAVWLIAAGIGTLPFAGLSNSANDAYFVQTLDRHLPSVPAVFEEFNKLLDPNATPKVYVKESPNSSIGEAALLPATPEVANAGQSVVRITSFGCGGVVSGSGFAVAPDLIATDAHVIAGVKRPIVKYGTQSYEGVPILFDANLDFAVLKVNKLKAAPLTIASNNVSTGTDVYAIGYPKSIYTISPGIVRNNLQIIGPNIYGVGDISRSVYEIQTNIDDGNSGGPVVLPNGQVAGIIFSKSDTLDYGYAVTSPSLLSEVKKAGESQNRVGTGVCFAG